MYGIVISRPWKVQLWKAVKLSGRKILNLTVCCVGYCENVISM